MEKMKEIFTSGTTLLCSIEQDLLRQLDLKNSVCIEKEQETSTLRSLMMVMVSEMFVP